MSVAAARLALLLLSTDCVGEVMAAMIDIGCSTERMLVDQHAVAAGRLRQEVGQQ